MTFRRNLAKVDLDPGVGKDLTIMGERELILIARVAQQNF